MSKLTNVTNNYPICSILLYNLVYPEYMQIIVRKIYGNGISPLIIRVLYATK